ncbi:MAG: pilus assembly protein [Micromonosporaceae bacterium]|nr:pilus assembly protein [Micromonosporaceae bacterium]
MRAGRPGPARRRPAPGRDRGGAAVELAILWPVLVLVVFGAVQVTTYFTARTVALSAAQVGVATERQYDAAPGSGTDRAEEFLAGAGDWLVQAQVGEPVRTDEEVFITVRGRALSVVPWVTWDIQQTARGTVERFTEAP